MDIIGDWIADCAIEEPDCQTPIGDLYMSSRTWVHESGYSPLGKNRFNRKLEERGFKQVRTTKNRCYACLRLVAKSTAIQLALVKGEGER